MNLLERKFWNYNKDPSLSLSRTARNQMCFARVAVEEPSERCHSAIWMWVVPDYYDLTLEGWRQALGAYLMTHM